LSNFGNSEELDKEYKKFVEKYKATGVCFACSGPTPIVPDRLDKDPDLLAPADLRAINNADVVGKKKTHDFKETRERSPIKKLAGIDDFRLIKEPDAPTKEEKALKDTKDYIVGGVKMNILDIKAIKNVEPPQSPSDNAGLMSGSKKKGGNSSKKGLVDGMSANAYGTFMK